ncbi:MAG TPA: MBL fold metallo-hydrolase [Acidimicrobiia bacterium]|nr:MBL fold metallo-hydrolase [Acidimicrobiia bacterium]
MGRGEWRYGARTIRRWGWGVQVTFWGTRGSIAKAGPTTVRYGGNTSCVSVRTEAGTLLVLDCGTGIHELGQVLSHDEGPVNGHLLIGHTHWDHIQGLPFFAPMFQPGNVWHVYGPRGLDTSIDKALEGQMQYTYFPVQLLDFGATIEYHDLVEGQFEVDDVTVTTRYLHHPALTIGYRIEGDGATLVYSTDHEPSTAPEPGPEGLEGLNREEAHHVAFLRDADLVIHDAQYLAEEYPAKVGWGHSPVEYAVDVACAADAQRLALFHHDPTRTDDAVDALVDRARARAREFGFTGEVFAAAEGATVTLTSTGTVEARPAVETARRTPALAELSRAVLIAVTDSEADAALHEAARSEGFDTLPCGDFDDVLHVARTQQPPIVVLEAAADRSLDELADDARGIVESYPEGATVAYVTTTTPPANEIRPEITDWLVWPASQSHLRTKLRAWLLRRACRWQSAALPVDESERMIALWNLGILDTEPEARFDRYTEVARSAFDVPIALVTFVDTDRQWFKSHPGLPVSETPRDESMCAHAILGTDVFVVSDALRDDRFADNPHVARGARLRFYAGVPLTLSDGHRVGTLCIMDHRPRVLDDEQVERLRDLGRLVEAELQSSADEPRDV